jgi:hypothetical protein
MMQCEPETNNLEPHTREVAVQRFGVRFRPDGSA